MRPYPQFTNVYAHRVTERARSLQRVEHGQSSAVSARAGAGASTTCSACARTIRSAKATRSPSTRRVPIDNYDLEREFGYSLLDAPHRLNISGSVELPFGPGKRWLATGGWLSALAGGWTVSGVGMYQSGFPVAVIQLNNNFSLPRQPAAAQHRPRRQPAHPRQPRGQLRSELSLYPVAQPRRMERCPAVYVWRRTALRRASAHPIPKELGYRRAQDPGDCRCTGDDSCGADQRVRQPRLRRAPAAIWNGGRVRQHRCGQRLPENATAASTRSVVK